MRLQYTGSTRRSPAAFAFACAEYVKRTRFCNFILTTVAWAATFGVAGCTPQQPNPKQVTPTDTSMRAETAIAATYAGGTQRIVTVFNDVSEKVLSRTGQKDIEFSANLQSITYRRGMSMLGWATSSDGNTWAYNGKLGVPPGWAALLGDPAIAIEADNSAVVYATTLALSDSGWNAAYPGVNQLPTPPKPNGFCVFRSSDGGLSFPASKCIVVGDVGDPDLTAVAVDGLGHVFVAVEDVGPVRVWRSGATWDALAESPLQCVAGSFPECTTADTPKSYRFAAEPRLVTDPAGEVWLMTVEQSSPSKLGLVSWDGNGNVDSFLELFGWCGALVPPMPPMVSGSAINVSIGTASVTQIRNAFRHSEAWGYTNLTQKPALRVAYEYNDVLGNRQIQIVEISEDFSSPALCGAPIGWNTIFSLDGSPNTSRNFMSALAYRNKGAGIGPTDMEWYLGYMNGNSARFVDPSKQYAGFELVGLLHSSTVQMLWNGAGRITPNNYFTCPTPTTGYWGDYFGVTQVLVGPSWHALATFTDSRPAPPCQATGPGIGMPMQIASGMVP